MFEETLDRFTMTVLPLPVCPVWLSRVDEVAQGVFFQIPVLARILRSGVCGLASPPLSMNCFQFLVHANLVLYPDRKLSPSKSRTMAFPFMNLPFELRAQVLFHCLVTSHPIAIASSGKRCYIGGLFLLENPNFFHVLFACLQLWSEGIQVFVTYNTFVFGDFVADHDYFDASPRWWPDYVRRDGRICDHPRLERCACFDFDSAGDDGPYANVDMDQVFAFRVEQAILGRIKHLVLVLHEEQAPYFNGPEDSNNLVQVFLFLARVNTMQAKLESLFVFTEQCHREEPPDHGAPSSSPHLDQWNAGRHFMPTLKSLAERSPRMHLHFSAFTHVLNNQSSGPSGPRLNTETATSARSYLSAVELGGGVDGWKLPPGISFSKIRPDGQRFEASKDGRYLLCFDATEQFDITYWDDYEGARLRIIAIRRVNLLWADRLCDHHSLLNRKDPWFAYQVFPQERPEGDRSATSSPHSIDAQLRRVQAARRDWPPLKTTSRVPFMIEERLWNPERTDEDNVELAGQGLSAVVMDWANQETPDDYTDDEDEWLYSFLMSKVLHDVALSRTQRRITDYFHPVDT